MADSEQQTRPSPLDQNPHAAKLAAVWHLLLSAQTDEEYAQAQEIAKKILAMSAQDVLALGEGKGKADGKPQKPAPSRPDQEHKKGDLIQFLRG